MTAPDFRGYRLPLARQPAEILSKMKLNTSYSWTHAEVYSSTNKATCNEIPLKLGPQMHSQTQLCKCFCL